jgi:hypothetical protein
MAVTYPFACPTLTTKKSFLIKCAHSAYIMHIVTHADEESKESNRPSVELVR